MAMRSQRCCITIEDGFCCWSAISAARWWSNYVVAGASKPSAEATKGWKDSCREAQMAWYLRRLLASCSWRTFMGSHARDVALSRLAMQTSMMVLVPCSIRPRMARSQVHSPNFTQWVKFTERCPLLLISTQINDCKLLARNNGKMGLSTSSNTSATS